MRPEPIRPAVTDANRAEFVLAFATGRVPVASLFFLLALLVRLYFVYTHPNFDNIFSVKGVPYSDGLTWVSPAITLAHGEGLGAVFRPGFSILLALFYVWFGTSFHVITALNVLVGATTAVFIYLVGEQVFTRTIASAAALFFVFDPSQLIQTPQATTEPLGLMFFAGSVYCLLRGSRTGKLKFPIIAGALLALSNLARPLTLFCAPFYAAYLALAEWLRAKKLTKALLPACAFWIGVMLTLSPWLIRQRLVHGVWTISTNMGEALYGATSPKYKTWKYTVRADADRAGIEPTLGARYKFFIAQSLKNMHRYPAFYARQVAHSYWEFCNSFSRAARSDKKAFGYGQWNGLAEGQVLFLLILIAFLFVGAMRMWNHAGPLAGGLVALCSLAFVLAWQFTALYSGIFILVAGAALRRSRFRRQGMALLGGSLAITGLANAIFNNAILYRAVLMTDWIFSLFYLAVFGFGATLLAEAVLHLLGKPAVPTEPATDSPATVAIPLVVTFGRAVKVVCKGAILLLAIFVLAGTVRLLLLNFGGAERHEVRRLRFTESEQREIVAQLRTRFPIVRNALSDPRSAKVKFIEKKKARPASAPKARKDAKPKSAATPARPGYFTPRTQLMVWSESLSPFLYYFPAKSEFELRDRLFRRRPFDCSIIRSSRGMVVFPGRIPRSFRDCPVVFVGWIEGEHPNGARFGQVAQCIAVIPVLEKSGKLDYENARIVKPRTNCIL